MLNAVIADFGFVTPLPTTVGSTSLVTAAGALTLAWSRGYLAPEITDGKHGVASDVYSYGVVGIDVRVFIWISVTSFTIGGFGDFHWFTCIFSRS